MQDGSRRYPDLPTRPASRQSETLPGFRDGSAPEVIPSRYWRLTIGALVIQADAAPGGIEKRSHHAWLGTSLRAGGPGPVGHETGGARVRSLYSHPEGLPSS
jgi:hypothetical protein